MTGRFTTALLREWLRPQLGSGAPIFSGREPDIGRVIVLSMQSGAGITMEGLFDTPAFQIRCRGAENNYDDAESIALDVDTIFMHAPTGFEMGDVYVDFIGRTGGAPQALPHTDVDNRYVFTCTYFAQVSTGL
jgi:hypothetical protein